MNKRSEASAVRDPLARKLKELGWSVRVEVPAHRWPKGHGRIDIVAERNGETRVIECKLREDWNAIGQVLRYTHAIDDSPSISPHVKPTIMLGELCNVEYYCVCERYGIDVWTPSMIRRGVQEVPFRC